jgi:CNT family concentrative nucleoside transporter
MERLTSAFGLVVLVGVLFLFSENKRRISWALVGKGVFFQLLFGFIILKTDFGIGFFNAAKSFVNWILDFSIVGAKFMFGPLAPGEGSLGFIFATTVFPTIIFVSALMSVIYHIGLMEKVVKVVAWVMVKVLGTSGAESLSCAANVFIGQTEAPLVIKPYVSKMTRSEILTMMTGGMAHISGGVLAAYAGMGIDAGYLVCASLMNAPAAILCSKILIPEVEESVTKGNVKLTFEKTTSSIIEAAAVGASDGMRLAVNVGAMLLAFIALIAMINQLMAQSGHLVGLENFTLETIFGYIFYPVAWLMGVAREELMTVSVLLAKKTVINEFIAYMDLSKLKETLSHRSTMIATFALCGFSNFSSIAIQVGGIGTLAPEKRPLIAQLGLRALLAGSIACFMTACVAGLMV